MFALVIPKALDELLHGVERGVIRLVELLGDRLDIKGLIVITSDAEVGRVAQRVGAQLRDSATFARDVLTVPALPAKKETGLSAVEVEEWERLFKKPKG